MAERTTYSAGAVAEETGYMHSGKNGCRWGVARPSATGQPGKENRWHLLKLNAQLEIDARLSRFNEKVIEERLNELDRIGGSQDAVYGLTLARINELALLCAGNYADHAEVQGVGDLLFNPRRILVYIKGMPGPVTKVRHVGLTEQFAHVAGTRGGVVAWLRDKTVTEIKLPPLLPYLYARLLESKAISRQYLDSVNDRMKKIADVTGFVASGHFCNGRDVHQWLQHAGAADRAFVESRLCRFDTKIFCELGNDLQHLFRMKTPSFGFIKDEYASSMDSSGPWLAKGPLPCN